jgi:hypothetical protein
VLIPEDEVEEADRRIAYERLVGRATAHLDHIRDILREGIDTGTVTLAPMPQKDRDDNDNWLHHPAAMRTFPKQLRWRNGAFRLSGEIRSRQ